MEFASANSQAGGAVSRWPRAYRVWMFLIQAFFVGMLVLPTSFQLQRGAALLILAGVALVVALASWRVHRDILFLWLSTMVVGAVGILLGVVNGAPGAMRVSTVYLIWPVLYLLFIGLAQRLWVVKQLESALLLGITLATMMSLAVLMGGVFGIGDVVFALLAFQDAGFGRYDGFTVFRIYNLSSVMYGFPFVFAFLTARRNVLSGLQKAGLWILLALMVVVAVGSGRRMFWLLVFMTPFLALFFVQISSLRMSGVAMVRLFASLGVALTVGGAAVVATFDIRLAVLMHEFSSAFLGYEVSSGLRYEQATALWRAFQSAPFFGIGLGSSVEVIRSEAQPWAYELAPLSLLKSVGLLGFAVYVLAISWIVLKGVALARRDKEFAGLFVPQVTAMTGFLAMTFTNPYLEKFDYLWVVFLPVALINASLIRVRHA